MKIRQIFENITYPFVDFWWNVKDYWRENKQVIPFIFKQRSIVRFREYLNIRFWKDFVFYNKPRDIMNLVCRIKGHPNGTSIRSWYNYIDPEYCCNNCGEELGG